MKITKHAKRFARDIVAPRNIVALGALKAMKDTIEEGEKELIEFDFNVESKDGKRVVVYTFTLKEEAE